MTKAMTHDEDLAGTDQAATQSPPAAGRSDGEAWEQRYNGLQGKLQQTQAQLADARSSWESERARWEAERSQARQLEEALRAAEGQLASLTGEKTGLAQELAARQKEQEALAAQLARQQVMLKYPQLVSDPILKLVQSSGLAAGELEETLAAMAQGREQMVKDAFQEAQSGATGAVSPAGQAGTREEQAQGSWRAALDALSKGDMDTYGKEYANYLRYMDETGASALSRPATLARPI